MKTLKMGIYHSEEVDTIMAIFSCKDCTERHVGCHSTCPKYLQEKAEHDKLREKIQKQNNNDFHLNSNGIEWAGKHRNHRR